jgi:hypothetical protein
MNVIRVYINLSRSRLLRIIGPKDRRMHYVFAHSYTFSPFLRLHVCSGLSLIYRLWNWSRRHAWLAERKGMDASSALPAAANVPRELHPLLSLVQAIVLSACTLRFAFSISNLRRHYSVWLVTFALRLVTITAPRLLFTTLSYSFTLTVRFISTPDGTAYVSVCVAELLVLLLALCRRRDCLELLDPEQIPECVCPTEGAPAREGERSRASPGCQYARQHPCI